MAMDMYSVLIPVLIVAGVVLVAAVPVLLVMVIVDALRAFRRRKNRS